MDQIDKIANPIFEICVGHPDDEVLRALAFVMVKVFKLLRIPTIADTCSD